MESTNQEGGGQIDEKQSGKPKFVRRQQEKVRSFSKLTMMMMTMIIILRLLLATAATTPNFAHKIGNVNCEKHRERNEPPKKRKREHPAKRTCGLYASIIWFIFSSLQTPPNGNIHADPHCPYISFFLLPYFISVSSTSLFQFFFLPFFL